MCVYIDICVYVCISIYKDMHLGVSIVAWARVEPDPPEGVSSRVG